MSAIRKHDASTDPGVPDPYPRRPRPAILPFDLPPLRDAQVRQMAEEQTAFDAAFPPIRTSAEDVLILNWDEIERQYLDLVAPWDLQNAAFQIRQARRMAMLETPEKTIRWLLVLAQSSPNLEAEEPRWGTGKSLPMP